jgi:hypothetical protein
MNGYDKLDEPWANEVLETDENEGEDKRTPYRNADFGEVQISDREQQAVEREENQDRTREEFHKSLQDSREIRGPNDPNAAILLWVWRNG